jgi:Protein of unknown function (DUF3141)
MLLGPSFTSTVISINAFWRRNMARKANVSESAMTIESTSTAVTQTASPKIAADPFQTSLPEFGAPVVSEYLTDSFQRTVLFLDLLRRRGNEQEEMTSRPMATVLRFDHEILISGRSLPKPINFSLSRIVPPDGTLIDPRKRPVVVVDPRAGQGPGIGGFKAQSEIGDALSAGHAVYFIGFAAKPEPGQEFLDIVEGQVKFFEHIVERHPDAPRPFAIGNCQAGYQTLMVAMLRPDLFGPCMMAGSPMSYWQGVHGKNPMRYSGGMLGGSWLTALTSDLGNGRFDGTWLILNFDNLNPANWLWGKQYQVYANIDTETKRFMEFERWWGDFIELNGSEIQFLVDQLFIGDKLTRNEIQSSDGKTFDIRNVTSPIIVLTSKGDNISPPQQTLGWILDLYRDVDDIRATGRTIVYCLNEKVGHLAIFVSAKVGGKEDEEILRLMDVIDCLPPGLYEVVITPRPPGTVEAGFGPGEWLTRFEMRTLDDIRALGRNSEADDRAFATAARVSEITNSYYRTFVQPFVRAMASAPAADAARQLNPLRMSYTMFADSNPWMKTIAPLAERAQAERQPVDPGNPLAVAEKQLSDQITSALDAYRDVRDRLTEQFFYAFYGSPVVQAVVGLNTGDKVRHLPGTTPETLARRAQAAEAYAARLKTGGYDQALIRSALYVALSDRTLDERVAAALNFARRQVLHLTPEEYKEIVRNQFSVLQIERDRAIEALPALVPAGRGVELLREVKSIVADGLTPGEKQRLDQLERILAATPTPQLLAAKPEPAYVAN